MNLRCQRCDWRPDPDADEDRATQFDAHAISAGHPRCICCGVSLTEHEPATCESCLDAVRGHIKQIVQLHAELPAHLGQPSGQSFGRRGGDEHTLPGGTVMAMLGPGNDGHRARRLTKLDRQRGVEGREHSIDNDPSDPPSVTWSLYSWAMDWAEQRDDMLDPTFAGVAGYLEVNARWAANQHDAFAYFAKEMRSLRLALEAVTGRTRKPTKAGADCLRCGHTLERKVDADTGLEDDYVTCSTCRTRLGPAEYASAVKVAAFIASRIVIDGEAYSTPEALGRALERSPYTLTNWARRDGICRAKVRAGVLFVHDGDATAAHEERKTRRTA